MQEGWEVLAAYNFAKHLKALRWRTPYQVICGAWTKDPSVFKIDPRPLIPGRHSQAVEGDQSQGDVVGPLPGGAEV